MVDSYLVVETDDHEKSAQLALKYEKMVREWKEDPADLAVSR